VRKTNPIGTGTTNLSVNISRALHTTLKKLATTSKMKLGEYCRALLEDAANEGTTFKKQPPAKHPATPERASKVA